MTVAVASRLWPDACCDSTADSDKLSVFDNPDVHVTLGGFVSKLITAPNAAS